MARGQSRGGALRVPVLRPFGITRFSVGTYLLLHLQKDDSVQQLAAHVATPRCLVPPNFRAPRHEGKAEGSSLPASVPSG